MTTVMDAPEIPQSEDRTVDRSGLRRPLAEKGLLSWVTTVDHKRIGIMYGLVAIVYLVIGGVEALFIRLQLAAPDGNVLSANQYNQFFTMHGTTMVFLVGMPMAAAFGNYLIPLMIGARDVAFPRLNMFGFWIFFFAGLFLYSSFLLGGAPNGGWFGYAPLNSVPMDSGFLPGRGPDFWALGLIFAGIGSVTSGLNFVVTILNMRAPGMRLMDMPVFVWMMLIVGFLTVFAMPPITAALMQVYSDRNFDMNFFNAANGGDPILYQHLFWIFGHPEVYILILPGMGIVSEVLPAFSRKPLFGKSVVVFSGIAIGFMGWGVWVHHMFVSGLGPAAVAAFGVSTMFIAVPTGVKIFNWLATVWGGKLTLNTSMLFSLGFIAMFTIGGLSGVMHSIVPADTQQTDTYFVVAHFHYVLFGGLVFAIFSGIYYWFPKMTGRYMDERFGKAHFWTLLLGFNLTFFPMHILGLQGQPRRTYTYPEGYGWDFWNLVSTVGSFIIPISVLIFVVNMVKSKVNGEIAPDDAWDGRTLEWAIPSPPPAYNFLVVPEVHGNDAFWHMKYTEDAEGRPVRIEEFTGIDTAGVDPHSVHMPSPSYWPLIVALGLLVTAYGFVFTNWITVGCGLTLTVYAMFGWGVEEPTEPSEVHQ